MIIDCHCHAGVGDGLTGPWDTAARLDRYERQARQAGITHTVLFSCFHSDYRIANRRVAEIVRRQRNRYWGFVFVNCRRDAGRIERLVREGACRDGFCGIKAHRYDGRITRELCDAAARLRLPVLYDPMGEVSVVEMIACEYPQVNFIIPHLSSFADDWKAQRAFLGVFERHANLFTDTSGVRWFDLLEEAIARGGSHKVLFGSDGPYLNPEVELAKIRALRLAPRAFAAITSGNWLRLTSHWRKRRPAIRLRPYALEPRRPHRDCDRRRATPPERRSGRPPYGVAALEQTRAIVELRG